jgi:hypothetical protein
MRTSWWTVRRQQCRLLLGIGALACAMGAGEAAAAYSEIESLHLAIVSRDKQAALAFIRTFPASPLVDDLIEMLPPEVAQQVCADLPSGAGRAQDACRSADRRLATRDPGGESGGGESAIASAAGPAARAQALAGARARPTGTTGERSAASMAMVLPPGLEDGAPAPEDDAVATTAVRKEAKEVPKPHRDKAAPAPRLGGDPGSDPGAASSPSSYGADPGSDPGSASNGDAGRDSHN